MGRELAHREKEGDGTLGKGKLGDCEVKLSRPKSGWGVGIRTDDSQGVGWAREHRETSSGKAGTDTSKVLKNTREGGWG